MRAEGLEPPRPKPPEPKSGVSTSFTTPALRIVRQRIRRPFDPAVYITADSLAASPGGSPLYFLACLSSMMRAPESPQASRMLPPFTKSPQPCLPCRFSCAPLLSFPSSLLPLPRWPRTRIGPRLASLTRWRTRPRLSLLPPPGPRSSAWPCTRRTSSVLARTGGCSSPSSTTPNSRLGRMQAW